MRVVRDNSPNQYMALIKLKSQKEADEFYMHNNNRQFNSIEESVCYLAFVERIEAINSSKVIESQNRVPRVNLNLKLYDVHLGCFSSDSWIHRTTHVLHLSRTNGNNTLESIIYDSKWLFRRLLGRIVEWRDHDLV